MGISIAVGCYTVCNMATEYKRRWKGFTPAQVSERMGMIRKNRFRTEKEKKEHANVMVEARGSWQIIDGKKVYVRNRK